MGRDTSRSCWKFSTISMIWVVALQIVLIGSLNGQAMQVGEKTLVSVGLDQRPLVEPHVTVHPSKPDHVLGAVIVSFAATSREEQLANQSCAVLLSVDGAKTWVRHDFPITECYDPWVAITTGGEAVFVADGKLAAVPQGSPELLVFRSPDGGQTWGEMPVTLGRGHDHPMVVAASSSEARQDWVYVVSSQRIRADEGMPRYSVFVARSRDAGKTFDAPIRVVPNNLIIKAETPAVLSDGTLIIPFVEAGHARVSVIDRLGWILRSVDAGYTFSMPLFVTEVCGQPPTFSLSALVADTSAGPFTDRLYFICNKRGGGAVIATSSDDRGESWSDPVRIHSAPEDTSVMRQVRAAAVNSRGVLGVVWTDRVGPDLRCYEVHFAASVDGGRTFVPEQAILVEPSCPSQASNGLSKRSWPTGGDYYGLAASPDGKFFLIWPEARRGTFQLWAAPIHVRVEAGAGLDS